LWYLLASLRRPTAQETYVHDHAPWAATAAAGTEPSLILMLDAPLS